MKYIVKNPAGQVVLKTIFESNAVARARQPGYTLLRVPVKR